MYCDIRATKEIKMPIYRWKDLPELLETSKNSASEPPSKLSKKEDIFAGKENSVNEGGGGRKLVMNYMTLSTWGHAPVAQFPPKFNVDDRSSFFTQACGEDWIRSASISNTFRTVAGTQ